MSSRPFLIALAVCILCFLIYFPFDLPTVGNASDNYWYVPTSISLLHQANLELSEYKELIEKRSGYGIVRYRGLPYNLFPYGTSLLILPVVAISEFFYGTSNEVARFFQIASISAKIMAALTVAFLFLTALRLTKNIRLALLLGLIFAFATSHFSLHAGGLWSHNTALLLITIALFLLTGPEQHISWTALPLAFAFMARPTTAIPIALITLYIFLLYRSQFLRFIAVGASVGLFFVLFNYHLFGRFVPPYYGGGRLNFSHFGEALAGNLISPNRGLLIFTPIFLGSIYGMYLSFRRESALNQRSSASGFYKLLSFIAILHWILISTFSHWWAGATIGPRFFGDILSVLTLLLIPAMLDLRKNRILYPFAAAALGWSLFAQIHSVTSDQVYRWNFTPVRLSADPSRIWDWKDMQILRTSLPQTAIQNLPYSFRIFRDGKLIARVMKSDVPDLVNTEVKIDRKKYKAIRLSDLLSKYRIAEGSLMIAGGDQEIEIQRHETADLYVYFVRGRVAKVYCNCTKEFPEFIESISVEGQ